MATLSEELLLLALDDQKGTIPPLRIGEVLDIALAGAQLLELTRSGHVAVEDGRVVAQPAAPPDSPALRQSLDRIAALNKPRKPDAIVLKLTRGLRKILLQQVADKGYVSVEKARVLGFIDRTRYPELDSEVEAQVRERLRAAIVDGQDPDERTVALTALLRAASLESMVLDRAERKAYKQRVKQIADGEQLQADIAKAIVSVQAAVGVAVLAATMTSASG